MAKQSGMKLALTSSEEILNLMQILNELEALYKYELKSTHFEDVDFEEYDILKTFNTKDPAEFIEDLLRHLYGIHHQRILWNCDTMLKHCADPALSYLDFNPDIKKGLQLLEQHNKGKNSGFKKSLNGGKLSRLLNKKFDLQLKPMIKRRNINCDKVKFEMIDQEENVYFFKGTVLEFLSKGITIEKDHRSFSFY